MIRFLLVATFLVTNSGLTIAQGFSEFDLDLTREVQQLRRTTHRTTSNAPDSTTAPAPPTTSVVHSPAVEAVFNKLKQKHDFDFDEASLADVHEWITETVDVNIFVDTTSLELDSVDLQNATVTFQARDTTCGAAFHHILQQHQLAYFVTENGLTVSSFEYEPINEAKIYPIADLIAESSPGYSSVTALYNLLIGSVQPSTWSALGGTGTLSVFKGTLTVSQSIEVHREITSLLEAMRSLANRKETTDQIVVDLNDSEANRVIRTKLKKPVSVRFEEATLVDVVDFFRSESDCTILFDEWSLSDESIRPAVDVVSGKLKEVKLGDALQLFLSQHGLTYIVDREAVLITTEERTEEALNTRIYDCHQFVQVSADVEQRDMDLSDLVDLLKAQITPDFWEHVGGPGSIQAYAPHNALVVSSTDAIHRKTETFLRMLARAKPTIGNEAINRNLTVQAYPLAESYRGAKGQELLKLLTDLLAGTDNALVAGQKDWFIRILGNHLVVSHRKQVQNPIKSILLKLQAVEVTEIDGVGLRGGMF